MLAANGVTRHFTFTGLRDGVPRVISATDVFALGTRCEGLPPVILGAMAQAKPVIAADVDGIPEIVRDGESGSLYPHGGDAQLAAQILNLTRGEARGVRPSLGRSEPDAGAVRDQHEEPSPRNARRRAGATRQ